MAAATAVTETKQPLSVQHYSFTLDPGSLAVDVREEQTVAIPGARVGDIVIGPCPRTAMLAGLSISHAFVSAVGVVSFYIFSHVGTVNQTSQTWDLVLIRGRKGSQN